MKQTRQAVRVIKQFIFRLSISMDATLNKNFLAGIQKLLMTILRSKLLLGSYKKRVVVQRHIFLVMYDPSVNEL
jgi:hypothetical protein